MAKTKTAYFCQQCGYESAKWMGKCPSCQAWNSLVEEIVHKEDKSKQKQGWEDDARDGKKAHRISEVTEGDVQRMFFPDPELNRVLGGGIVPGSVILVAGEPGIGKSTLFLQSALTWKEGSVLYVSGEESSQQIKLRAERIGGHNEQLFLLTATDTA